MYRAIMNLNQTLEGRMETNLANKSADKKPSALIWVSLSLGAVLLLAFNLFVMTPMLIQSWSQGGASFLYLAVRVLVFIGLAFGLTRFGMRTRYQTISTVMLIALIDQVVFKALTLMSDLPEGITFGTMIIGIGTGFMFFSPVVFILGFLGVELGKLKKG